MKTMILSNIEGASKLQPLGSASQPEDYHHYESAERGSHAHAPEEERDEGEEEVLDDHEYRASLQPVQAYVIPVVGRVKQRPPVIETSTRGDFTPYGPIEPFPGMLLSYQPAFGNGSEMLRSAAKASGERLLLAHQFNLRY